MINSERVNSAPVAFTSKEIEMRKIILCLLMLQATPSFAGNLFREVGEGAMCPKFGCILTTFPEAKGWSAFKLP